MAEAETAKQKKRQNRRNAGCGGAAAGGLSAKAASENPYILIYN